MEQIVLRAHAKLNLSLEIVGLRSDGYHDILSLMQGIGLCDEIKIKKCPQNGTKYNLPHCTIEGYVVYLCTDASTIGNTIPTDMNNLAFKGVDALLRVAKDKIDTKNAFGEGILIEIDKRLPVAAGIAGGSGNAAASMLGLNALLGHPLSLRELMEAGASVGADVPFSLMMNAYRNRDALAGLSGMEEASDAAWMEGIGDIVTPAEPLSYHVILANPGISVSTPEAYKAMDAIGYPKRSDEGRRKLFVNDLEEYAMANYPEIAELKSLMTERLGADEVLMSGSGASVAAYYKDKARADKDFEIMKGIVASETGRGVWLTETGEA